MLGGAPQLVEGAQDPIPQRRIERPLHRPELVERNAPAREELRARAEALAVHPLLVRLLYGRGLEALDHQRAATVTSLGRLRAPAAMAGFEAALDRIVHAYQHRWRVGVFGDYDVDGVTTTTLLTTYLEALGVATVSRVAHRERGYGFTVEDADRFIEAGCQLVLTADVGTSDLDALARLRSAHVQSVVIDHHQVPSVEPPTDALMNPHQATCGFPFKGLCSAGVGFYLCAGLRTRLAKQGVKAPDPRAWLDLVAVATLCDLMPLHDENRILVRAGLRHLGQVMRPGLQALLERAGVDAEATIDEDVVGFTIGPRLNAPGRLGSAEPSLRLLQARSLVEARPIAEQIEMLNTQRRRYTDDTIDEALAMLIDDPRAEEHAAIVVAKSGWLPGIVGIAASGLVERFDRPAAVLAIDDERGIAHGSVRSIAGVDVKQALDECSALLTRYGGHREAAGMSLAASDVDAFREAFNAAVARQRSAENCKPDIETVDCALPLRVVDEGLCRTLGELGPYGVGFAPPRFWVEDVRVESLRVLKDRHLSLGVSDRGVRCEAIAFRHTDEGLRIGDRVGLIFTPSLDHFRGRSRIKLRVERLWRVD